MITKHNFWHKMSNGEFSHFVATINNGITSYYIDGKLVNSSTESYDDNGYLLTSETNNSQEMNS